MTKSYAFERRTFDVAPSCPDFILDDAAAAERIEEDLFGLAGEVEIGLDIGGRRWALVAFAEDLVDEIQPLTAEDTWLVSGGGSGVTAASIIGVAQASPKAGARFELLGRSTLIESTASWIDWSDTLTHRGKNALRERLVEASENGKVTMVEWNEHGNVSLEVETFLTLDAIAKTKSCHLSFG